MSVKIHDLVSVVDAPFEQETLKPCLGMMLLWRDGRHVVASAERHDEGMDARVNRDEMTEDGFVDGSHSRGEIKEGKKRQHMFGEISHPQKVWRSVDR